MSVDPWMKWYPADWRAEARLRMVPRAARSLWLDMLGLMHESVEYGFLLIGGVAPTAKQLAAVLGDKVGDVSKWLLELEAVGVFSRDARGVIFSRRMVRDKAKREKDKENGKRGGNPTLNASDMPPVKQGVNPPLKAHIPEARVQKPEEEVGPRAEARSAPKATRWRSEQTVSEDWLEEAGRERATHGLAAIDLRLEAVKFANHWASKSGRDATKQNWHLTWINWALKAYPTPSNAKVSSHDKGTQGAALFLAKVESGDAPRAGDGTREIGNALPANGHGRAEMGADVREFPRGLQGQEPRGNPLRLPAVSSKG